MPTPTTRQRARGRIWLWLGASLAFAPIARAQMVTGRVAASTTGMPVPGAIVALVDSSGRAVSSALAEDDGTFRLTSPTAGRFSVRVERVGYRSSTSPPVMLAQGATVDVPITIVSDGVSLRAVQVNADRRCLVRPQEGLAVARLWDEARKALSSTQLTQLAQAAARSRRDPHRFVVRTRKFARDLTPSLKPLHEEQFQVEGETITPFATQDPVLLAREGYMSGDLDNGAIFYAPDAAILLSDRFLDSHCFRVEGPRRGMRDNLIGLAFEPSRVTRARGGYSPRVEVTGILWLDRATAELRYMDYHYVDMPVSVPDEAAGGQLEFRPLPDGRWIVWRWYVRAPQLVQRQSGLEPYSGAHTELKGIHEEGAEILEVMPPGSRRPGLASLRGIATDSIRGAPLSGARVFLSGTSFAAVTSADGSYAIDAIPPGKYTMSILTSRLDTLLLDPPVRELSLSAGQEEHVNFAVPSLRGLSRRLCPDVGFSETASILLGVVRDTSGARAPGADVRVEWNEFSSAAAGRIAQRPLAVETKTLAGGRFALCGLPPNARLTVRASRERNSVVGPVLHLGPGEVRRLDLQLHAR